MLPEDARHLRDDALAEWTSGRFYEAHEILEDLAECFEEDDPSFEWALALTRIAACLHKLSAEVGVRAVPGKLHHALESLSDAPSDWCGLDMDRLRSELGALAGRIVGLTEHPSVPKDLHYPVPRLVAG